MKRIIVCAIAAIMISVLLVGCTSQLRNTNDQGQYRVGSEGLRIQFMQNTPPTTAYDDQELNVVIQVDNRGATILEGSANRIYLDGFSTDIITGIPINGKVIDRLEGKNRYNINGDTTIIDLQGYVRDLGSRGIDRLPQTIKATVCYGYETIATATVCIDPNPFSTRSEEVVCQGGQGGFSIGTGVASNLGGGQGAPIAVSAVLTDSLPDRTKFRVTIRNVGGGVVFRDGFTYLDRCNPYDPGGLDTFRDVGFVHLDDVQIDGISITGTCTPQKDDGNIQLINNEATIFCEYASIPQENPYITPLTIKLKYGYRTSISKQINLYSLPQ